MLNLRSNWQDVNDDAMNETKNNVREYRFPLSIFPPVLQQLIIEANRTCNFPMSYMGASMLFALSTAIGNTCTLRVKRNRLERCILYLHLIGEPGSAKSHPLTIGVLYAGTSVRHTECPPLAVADKRTVIVNRCINQVPMTVAFWLFIG